MGIGTRQGIHQSLVEYSVNGIVLRNTPQLHNVRTAIDLNHRSSLSSLSKRGFVRGRFRTQPGNPTTQNDNGSLLFLGKIFGVIVVLRIILIIIVIIIILGQSHGFRQGCRMHRSMSMRRIQGGGYWLVMVVILVWIVIDCRNRGQMLLMLRRYEQRGGYGKRLVLIFLTHRPILAVQLDLVAATWIDRRIPIPRGAVGGAGKKSFKLANDQRLMQIVEMAR